VCFYTSHSNTHTGRLETPRSLTVRDRPLLTVQKREGKRIVLLRLRIVTVQYSTVQDSTVQYSIVQLSTVHYSTVQQSTVQRTVQHDRGAVRSWKGQQRTRALRRGSQSSPLPPSSSPLPSYKPSLREVRQEGEE
jgi:hypothetical protein